MTFGSILCSISFNQHSMCDHCVGTMYWSLGKLPVALSWKLWIPFSINMTVANNSVMKGGAIWTSPLMMPGYWPTFSCPNPGKEFITPVSLWLQRLGLVEKVAFCIHYSYLLAIIFFYLLSFFYVPWVLEEIIQYVFKVEHVSITFSVNFV